MIHTFTCLLMHSRAGLGHVAFFSAVATFFSYGGTYVTLTTNILSVCNKSVTQVVFLIGLVVDYRHVRLYGGSLVEWLQNGRNRRFALVSLLRRFGVG